MALKFKEINDKLCLIETSRIEFYNEKICALCFDYPKNFYISFLPFLDDFKLLLSTVFIKQN